MRTLRLAACAAVVILSAGPAMAQEVIATAPATAPPVGEAAPAPVSPQTDPQSPEAIGQWARDVIAGKPAEIAAAPGGPEAGRCAQPVDRKPHGEVWGGIGTRGYRNVGGVVTQPLGKCGSVTVAIDHSEWGDGRKRR